MAQESIIDLKDFVKDSLQQFIKTYPDKLKPGIYHLITFRVFRHPQTHRYMAFLNCKEGRFWTCATMITWDLVSDIGEIVKQKTRKDGSIVKIELGYVRKQGTKTKGLGFIL